MGGRGRKPALAAALLFGVLAVQFYYTVVDRNRWPFCSNNMFNRTLPRRFPQLRIRLRDGAEWTGLRQVYGLMPLEFFRVVDICAGVLLENEDPGVKDRFCETIVRRLNTRPWPGFDEVRRSERPVHPGGFTGLEILMVNVDVGDYRMADDAPLYDQQVLHRWEAVR
ncbi:hypothetical protein OIE66_40300 [Nonomuraea sp. NBC_01738]|uniref:hypothetical protein n=1 Tax=Nonomuraea sp. NBC_01738 TaxID=2976003 RepID=UPI002E0FBA5B|nr:hypothetical protein OIE66_40300 [Nonomuraea sp. NBC_01738]